MIITLNMSHETILQHFSSGQLKASLRHREAYLGHAESFLARIVSKITCWLLFYIGFEISSMAITVAAAVGVAPAKTVLESVTFK